MKKVYLIHGWGGNGSGGWFDWLKNTLDAEVISFDMPNTDEPKIEEWVGFLKKNIKEVDENTYFVGHSIGCQTIMRFLENLPESKKIGGCVFVAGWFNLKEVVYADEEDKEIAMPWIETPIDFEKIKSRCKNFLAIFSDNDPYVPVSDADLFKEKLNAKTVIKENKEHFNQVESIPEILEFIS